MMVDDDNIRTQAGLKLEELSINELHNRIALLEAEIILCKGIVARKQTERSAAEALFSKKTEFKD